MSDSEIPTKQRRLSENLNTGNIELAAETLPVNSNSKAETSTKIVDSEKVERKDIFENKELAELSNNASSKSKLRQFLHIPVFIVEYHDHVLDFICRCVGSRHIQLEGNMLVHFDSHPDMVVSREMLADDAYDKTALLQQSSIESWIMPLCYTGIITRIVWLKNSWCQQIPLGYHKFMIGKFNDKICVDLALPYFLSEGCYCDTSKLENSRDIELFVVNISDCKENVSNNESFLLDVMKFFENEGEPMPYILDIDLDFFSTANPFLSMYKNFNCYEQLADIFALTDTEKEPSEINRKRVEKLEALKWAFLHLEQHNSLDDYKQSDDLPKLADSTFQLLKCFVSNIRSCYPQEQITWMLLYDAGCTSDSGGLPHHISSDDELLEHYEVFETFLKKLPRLPVVITISRSSEDDYCPPNQVENIQETVLYYIDKVLGDKVHEDAIYAYLDEEFNVMDF